MDPKMYPDTQISVQPKMTNKRHTEHSLNEWERHDMERVDVLPQYFWKNLMELLGIVS